jgi:hypothetical protein
MVVDYSRRAAADVSARTSASIARPTVAVVG